MAGKDQTASAKQLRDRLNEWDTSSGSDRQMLLQAFLDEFAKEPCGTTMESCLANGGSLLLARFLVFLQLTYTQYRSNGNLLKALGIFITSPEGDRFAAEVIEGGLLVTLFDMVLSFECSCTEKAETFGLLIKIAKRGRRYKEAICESNGIKVICESIYHSGAEINTGDEYYGGEKERLVHIPLQVPPQSRSAKTETVKKSHSHSSGHKRQDGVGTSQRKGKPRAATAPSKSSTDQKNPHGPNGDQPCPNDDEDEVEVKTFRPAWDLVSIRSSVDRVGSLMLIMARDLLIQLVNGNPKYQQELTTHVLKLLDAKSSVSTQLVACQVLRVVLPNNLGLCGRALEPAANLLGVSSVSLLHEAIQLLQVVAVSPWRGEVVHKLVGLIGRPHGHTATDTQKHPLYVTEPDLSDFPETSGTSAMFHVQADAILALGHILTVNTLDEVIANETVLHLVETFATTFYPESQRRAATVLRALVTMSQPVGDQLAEMMPAQLLARIMALVSMSQPVGDQLAEMMPAQLLARIMADPVDAANTLPVSEAKRLRSWVRVTRGKDETEIRGTEKTRMQEA